MSRYGKWQDPHASGQTTFLTYANILSSPCRLSVHNLVRPNNLQIYAYFRISLYFAQVFHLHDWVKTVLSPKYSTCTAWVKIVLKKVYQLGAPRNRLTINELSIFRVAGSPTLKMRTSLNIKLLRIAPQQLLFSAIYTEPKTRNITLHTNTECHASQRPNLLQFIATQPAMRDAWFQNLLNRPILRRHHLPQYHIHTGHHKLCRPLCILTQKNQFASKKRPSYLSA